MQDFTIHPETKIGHVHLKVSDIEQSLKFYRDLLGFEVMGSDAGDQMVFLSAGGYHHHIALNTLYSKNSSPAPLEHTGLFHAAILFPNLKELAKVTKRLVDANWPIGGAVDHGISQAVYTFDPDRNGIELYVDRPKKEWPLTADGKLDAAAFSEPLSIEDILQAL